MREEAQGHMQEKTSSREKPKGGVSWEAVATALALALTLWLALQTNPAKCMLLYV